MGDIMRSLFLLLALSACGSDPNPASTTHYDWYDYCTINTIPIVNETTCANAYHIQCLDGDNSWSELDALGSEGLGTPCYQDPSGTYLYVCLVDQDNKAVVRCSH